MTFSLYGRGGRNRTYANGFGDRCTATIRHPRNMNANCFARPHDSRPSVSGEKTNVRQSFSTKLEPLTGIEPVTSSFTSTSSSCHNIIQEG